MVECLISMQEALDMIPELHKLDMIAQIWNPTVQEVEAGVSDI